MTPACCCIQPGPDALVQLTVMLMDGWNTHPRLTQVGVFCRTATLEMRPRYAFLDFADGFFVFTNFLLFQNATRNDHRRWLHAVVATITTQPFPAWQRTNQRSMTILVEPPTAFPITHYHYIVVLFIRVFCQCKHRIWLIAFGAQHLVSSREQGSLRASSQT